MEQQRWRNRLNFRGLGNTFLDQRRFGSGEGSQRFSVVALIAAPWTNCDIPDGCVSPYPRGMTFRNPAASVNCWDQKEMAQIRRKRWLRVLGIVVAMAFAARITLWATEPTTTLPSPPTPGTFTLVIKSGGFDRVAQIHIPTRYKADQKPPLVLLLHGGGGGATHALEKDGWAAKADKEGFLIVAPEGLGALPKLPTNFKFNPALWNSGQLNARSPRAMIDDVAFVRELLDELKE
jgi:hypothetical protein